MDSSIQYKWKFLQQITILTVDTAKSVTLKLLFAKLPFSKENLNSISTEMREDKSPSRQYNAFNSDKTIFW